LLKIGPDTAAVPVTIRVGNDRATFDGARWSGADERLVAFLELLTPRDQLSPSVGRPDVFVANYVVPRLDPDLDAEILDVTPSSDADAGVVY
jgi:hypothetical protein